MTWSTLGSHRLISSTNSSYPNRRYKVPCISRHSLTSRIHLVSHLSLVVQWIDALHRTFHLNRVQFSGIGSGLTILTMCTVHQNLWMHCSLVELKQGIAFTGKHLRRPRWSGGYVFRTIPKTGSPTIVRHGTSCIDLLGYTLRSIMFTVAKILLWLKLRIQSGHAGW